MKTAGIVLAGGLSSRFGSPKAFAEFGGRRFYEISLHALSAVCDTCVIVTRPELAALFPEGQHVITDIEAFQGQGPVAGILSAMEALEADRYAVLPCDMPFMEPEVMERLAALHAKGVTAAELDGKLHPLVSIWDGGESVRIELRKSLENGNRRVMAVQERIGVTWMDGRKLATDAKHILENVNTPDVLERRGSHGTDHR